MALGYLIGKIRFGSFSLGVAGALFAGIIVSAISPDLALPPLIYTLGLILFIYTTGLSLGPTFFSGLKRTGLRDNLLSFGIIFIGAAMVVVTALMFKFDGLIATGMYTGTFTVTPALAGVLDAINDSSALPVVGYSLAYPFSIVASLLLIGIMRRVWKIDKKESTNIDASINPHTVLYLRKDPVAVQDVATSSKANVTISRILSKGKLSIATDNSVIKNGDYVTVIGTPGDYNLAVKWMGRKSSRVHLETEHHHIHERRVFISSIKLAGKSIAQLKLQQKFNVVATRLRRGDIDMVVHDDFIVELGDRLRMVGSHVDIDKAAKYLGDSYKSVAHFNVLSLAIGISLGILVGLITFPLPGGKEISLGAAGGTIIIALILGGLRRTGPLVWQIPFATNLSLRQLGLMMFLAGVGSTAGSAFAEALGDPISYQLMIISLLISLVSVFIMLIVGYKFLKIPFSRLSGMIAAMNTQPATLAFANGLTKTEDANIGYASVYPMALITKIIIAQVILLLLT